MKGFARSTLGGARTHRAANQARAARTPRADDSATSAGPSFARAVIETLETRQLFVASFDVTDLTSLRENPRFVDVDGSDVAVAVLDTGLYSANAALQPNVVAWYNAVADPVDTPLTLDGGAAAFDIDGHGTHVAGIASSADPNVGVAYASKIVGVKVLAEPGEPQLGGNPIARGLRWVKLHAQTLNIKVVNLSLGVTANINADDPSLNRTELALAIDDLEALGITVVAASGNSYAEFTAPGATFPAAISTISVGNTWATTGRQEDFGVALGGYGDRYLAIEGSADVDRFAATSQRSTLSNQLVAPGQDIYSTWNGLGIDGAGGSFKILSGTSMAAPFVSGAVALMQDAAKTFGGQYLADPRQILDILRNTADVITDVEVPDNQRFDLVTGELLPLPETGLTFHRVNVERAIGRVFEIVTAGNPNPDGGDPLNDTDSVRATATIVPVLNARRTFSYTGSIGSDGQVSIGDADVDLYRVSLQTRGNLTLSLALPDTGGIAGDLTLRLFNTAGAEVGRATGADPVLHTDPTAPLDTGLYYIGVSGAGNVSYDIVGGSGAIAGAGPADYALTLALTNPDPNGVAQGAIDADLGIPDDAIDDPIKTGRTVAVSRLKGTLGSDSPIIGSPDRIAVDADVDMVRVVASDDGVLNVFTQAKALYGNKGADTLVQVYDEDLTMLGENDDIDSVNADSLLSVPVVRGGIYYVAVTVFGNRDFDARDPYASRTPNTTPADRDYDLLLWADNGDVDGSALTAGELKAGQSVAGVVGSDDGVLIGTGLAPNKDVDWRLITADKDGLFEFRAVGDAGFSPNISLWQFDATGTLISRVADQTGADASLAIRLDKGRQIFVAVTGAGNEGFNWFSAASGVGGAVGAYTLSATRQPAAVAKLLTNDSLATGTPTPLKTGELVNAVIGRDNNVVIGPADIDLYEFKPEQNGVYRFRTITGTEDDADTVLRLFDAQGRQISFNDNDDPNGSASRLAASLKAGKTYYLGVTGAGPGALDYSPLDGAGAGEGLGGRYGLIADLLPPGSASLTFSESSPARYVDADGRSIVLRLSGPGVGRLDVEGPGPENFHLVIDDTDLDTTLRIEGNFTIGSVRVNGPLAAFRAGGVILGGDLQVESTLGFLYLAGATLGSDISATLIGSMRIGGDFGAHVAVSGDIGAFRSDGNLTGGLWEAAGGVQQLNARDVLPGWEGRFGGFVGTISVRSFAGDLSAMHLDRLVATSDVTGATLNLVGGGIGSIWAGRLLDSVITTTGDIESIIVSSSAERSTVYAGVDPATVGLPSSGDAFASPARIGGFVVGTGIFADTRVAATDIGRVSIRTVNTTNAGVPFGVAATSIGSVSVNGALKWKTPQPRSALPATGDFIVRLLDPVEPRDGESPGVPG